jgi:hypothetical protein
VQLEIQNPFPRVLRLDGPSVAEHGQLSNDLFAVTVDGKEIHYSGMMAKRAPPSQFIELVPLATHTVEVELGESYAIPRGEHHVTIAYRHTNHFSPDDLLLHSPPLEIHLVDQGFQLGPKPTPR